MAYEPPSHKSLTTFSIVLNTVICPTLLLLGLNPVRTILAFRAAVTARNLSQTPHLSAKKGGSVFPTLRVAQGINDWCPCGLKRRNRARGNAHER